MEIKKIHPLIPEAQEHLRKGNISRRDFLRFSTLLGLSLASARYLAACGRTQVIMREAEVGLLVNRLPLEIPPQLRSHGWIGTGDQQAFFRL